MASYVVMQQATYAASVVDGVLQSCFLLHQDIAPPPRMNIYPEVDLGSSKSPPQ